MDIERLIDEQKKTQEAIGLLRESKSYDEILKKIQEVKLDWRESTILPDPWDYEESSIRYDMMAARFIKEAVDNFGKAKYCLTAVKNHYESSIKQWEDYRKYCESLPKDQRKRRGYWKTSYSNPICQKFFEEYEKAHKIEDSIYKEVYGKETK